MTHRVARHVTEGVGVGDQAKVTGVQAKGAGDGAGDRAHVRVNGSSEEMGATKKRG